MNLKKLPLLGLIFALMACGLPTFPAALTPSAAPQNTATSEASPSPQASPTLAAPSTLTICLGQEPNTLYPYDKPNLAARAVLAALYDGPIDVFTNGYQPVIVESIPSLAKGDAQRVPVKVKRGDPVTDVNGSPVILETGTQVYPAGCADLACSLRFDGQTSLEMDQMTVTFHLKPGLLWSDGIPLTAADSVYAFTLASDPATPAEKYLLDRTQRYETIDDLTVQWWGRPGFLDPTYADNFWSPLPHHAWGTLSAADLLRADLTTRPPLGWGAYVFKEWQPGQYIQLEKNPNYFRAAENLPTFQSLVFRFLPDTESGISGLTAGECDLLDASLRLEGQLNLLQELQNKNTLQVVAAPSPLMERLDLGINPASYDDGISAAERPNLFADVRTRQAIAACLDREKVNQTVLNGLSAIPDTFVPVGHPLRSEELTRYTYDPNLGVTLLEQAGWKDDDGNPSTPRKALNVSGVPNGTPLLLRYLTTSALQRRQVSEILHTSLAACGIGLEITYLTPEELYAPGGAGPLFGRQFDLAEYAISPLGSEPACAAFTTQAIPSAANGWIGVNVSGYKNPDFDALCQQAQRTLPDDPSYASVWAQLQSIYANDLPSLPLYQRLKVVAARPDFCNLNVDSTTLFDLWNLEEYAISAACQR